jgi:hypothetical protein
MSADVPDVMVAMTMMMMMMTIQRYSCRDKIVAVLIFAGCQVRLKTLRKKRGLFSVSLVDSQPGYGTQQGSPQPHVEIGGPTLNQSSALDEHALKQFIVI